MVKHYIGLVIMLCCLSLITAAQNETGNPPVKKSCSCGFSSINQLGIVSGESDNQLTVQSINGFRYKTWFAGIGLGWDTYGAKTAPLFLDLRKSLLRRASTPFLYADGGIQLAGEKTRGKGTGLATKLETGAYFDFGMGYSIGLKNKNALLLSAGYSIKNIKWSSYQEVACVTTPCYPFVSSYKYRLNRLAFRLGYQF